PARRRRRHRLIWRYRSPPRRWRRNDRHGAGDGGGVRSRTGAGGHPRGRSPRPALLGLHDAPGQDGSRRDDPDRRPRGPIVRYLSTSGAAIATSGGSGWIAADRASRRLVPSRTRPAPAMQAHANRTTARPASTDPTATSVSPPTIPMARNRL